MPSVPQIQASYQRLLAQVGEPVVIRRYTGSGVNRPKFDVQVQARVVDYSPTELIGTIQQGDRKLICLASDLIDSQFALPVLPSDKVVVRGKELQIIAVDDSTRRVTGDLIALEIQARG